MALKVTNHSGEIGGGYIVAVYHNAVITLTPAGTIVTHQTHASKTHLHREHTAHTRLEPASRPEVAERAEAAPLGGCHDTRDAIARIATERPPAVRFVTSMHMRPSGWMVRRHTEYGSRSSGNPVKGRRDGTRAHTQGQPGARPSERQEKRQEKRRACVVLTLCNDNCGRRAFDIG